MIRGMRGGVHGSSSSSSSSFSFSFSVFLFVVVFVVVVMFVVVVNALEGVKHGESTGKFLEGSENGLVDEDVAVDVDVDDEILEGDVGEEVDAVVLRRYVRGDVGDSVGPLVKTRLPSSDWPITMNA